MISYVITYYRIFRIFGDCMTVEKIIFPGDLVFDGVLRIPNTYVKDRKTYAAVVGMFDKNNRYIPLEAQYTPNVGDFVVGMVTEARSSGYNIDLSMPYKGFVSTKFRRIKLDLGEVISGKIYEIRSDRTITISDARRLPNGKVITFPPAKIPRLIGRKSSMIDLIQDGIQGDLVVGNNGYIWVSENANIPLFLKVVDYVVSNAQHSGLTDAISKLVGKPPRVEKEDNNGNDDGDNNSKDSEEETIPEESE